MAVPNKQVADFAQRQHDKLAKVKAEKKQLNLRIKELEDKLISAETLLGVANCPECIDKSGANYDEHGEAVQCQWCYEVKALKDGGE